MINLFGAVLIALWVLMLFMAAHSVVLGLCIGAINVVLCVLHSELENQTRDAERLKRNTR